MARATRAQRWLSYRRRRLRLNRRRVPTRIDRPLPNNSRLSSSGVAAGFGVPPPVPPVPSSSTVTRASDVAQTPATLQTRSITVVWPRDVGVNCTLWPGVAKDLLPSRCRANVRIPPAMSEPEPARVIGMLIIVVYGPPAFAIGGLPGAGAANNRYVGPVVRIRRAASCRPVAGPAPAHQH